MESNTPKWIQVECVNCRGTGVVMVYSSFDCEGVSDCKFCCGGVVWVHTKSGVGKLYPSGPFNGDRYSQEEIRQFIQERNK